MHYDHKQSEVINANTWKNDFFNPQYNFGHGLSYTKFEYSNMNISKSAYSLSEKEITVTVDVKNTGKISGKEVVQLYSRDHFATISGLRIHPGKTILVPIGSTVHQVQTSHWYY